MRALTVCALDSTANERRLNSDAGSSMYVAAGLQTRWTHDLPGRHGEHPDGAIGGSVLTDSA